MKKYKVKDYNGWWSKIDEYKDYVLLEHCAYGDETCYLVVKKYAPIVRKFSDNTTFSGTIVGYYYEIQEVVCETFDDIITALEDEGIL